MKFKVGDKVRYVTRNGSNYNEKGVKQYFQIGQVYTVRDYCDSDNCYIFLQNGVVGEFERCFELAVETSKSEIEDLIQRANDGFAAREILFNKFPNQFVADTGIGLTTVFRVKPKPSFLPFMVRSQWEVSLRDDMLVIGCQKFDIKEFKNAVKVAETTEESAHLNREYLTGGRHGVEWKQGYKLNWAEIDQIMKALESAGL